MILPNSYMESEIKEDTHRGRSNGRTNKHPRGYSPEWKLSDKLMKRVEDKQVFIDFQADDKGYRRPKSALTK